MLVFAKYILRDVISVYDFLFMFSPSATAVE